ncbi:MAG TPA: hypothetical protein VGI64_03230, partial [Streptosporangiaceae bacterium]
TVAGVVEETADERGVVVADLHAVQGLLDSGPVSRAHGQGGEGLRVPLAVGNGLQDDAGGLRAGQRVHGRGQLFCTARSGCPRSSGGGA